jgi:hypothetical protein
MRTDKQDISAILELKKGTLIRVILNYEERMSKPDSVDMSKVRVMLDSDIFDGIGGRLSEIVGYLVKKDRKEQIVIINPFGLQHSGPHRNGYRGDMEYFITDGVSVDLDSIKRYELLKIKSK